MDNRLRNHALTQRNPYFHQPIVNDNHPSYNPSLASAQTGRVYAYLKAISI